MTKPLSSKNRRSPFYVPTTFPFFWQQKPRRRKSRAAVTANVRQHTTLNQQAFRCGGVQPVLVERLSVRVAFGALTAKCLFM